MNRRLILTLAAICTASYSLWLCGCGWNARGAPTLEYDPQRVEVLRETLQSLDF